MAAVGTSRSRRLQVRRKSSQFFDVVCTARRQRTFNSLWPLTRSDLLFTQTSAGTPMGRDAGNSADILLQNPYFTRRNFCNPSCKTCSYKCSRPLHALFGQFNRMNTCASMARFIIWLPHAGLSPSYSFPSEDNLTSYVFLSF